MRLFFLGTFILLLSCKKEDKLPPINDKVDLDGALINDSSLSHPDLFLVSAGGMPIPEHKKVIIAVHGFSASSFEWVEFSSFCRTNGDIPVSRVLLGGHGRDYQDFKKATWEDWQQPVIDEYNRLTELGYRHISFVAASTGCPLVLDMINRGKVDVNFVNKVFLVDPIVVPSNKQLSLAPLVGGTLIHYTESGIDPGENGLWYKYRPAEALKQLNTLTKDIRKRLENEMEMPSGARFFVYKSERDGSADPVSAVIIDKGIAHCETRMFDSGLHVLTRLAGRPLVTEADRRLQLEIFGDIHSKVKEQ